MPTARFALTRSVCAGDTLNAKVWLRQDGTAKIWSIESFDELMVRGCRRWVGLSQEWL
ncbi:hypothetical protein [Brasilonema bromeliae]|uniref:hypothetical protein n=1 Tax=Brasilonema bromeliae TaxID=383615 RepID=UPI00145D44C4|nr:hypothetical protein [Brasilonema bromeliae]